MTLVIPGPAQRAETCKIGPRELTFLVDEDPGPTGFLTLSNCPRAVRNGVNPTKAQSLIQGPDGTFGTVALLKNGWYRLSVINGSDIWVAQVSPSAVATAVPGSLGIHIAAGDSISFYVAENIRDGALVLFQCSVPDPLLTCGTGAALQTLPLAIVNRTDTILPGTTTGNTVSAQKLMAPERPRSC